MQCCCDENERDLPSTPPPLSATPPANSWRRRISGLTQWAIPITTLALIPKCPACVAAYILLLSGVGLPFSMASKIRLALIFLCVGALAFLLLRKVVHLRRAAVTRPH